VLVLVVPACRPVEVSALSYRLDLEIEKRGGGEQLAMLDPNLPERRIADLCRKSGIDVRLLLEPLRTVARGGKTNYVSNAHLNGRGSSLAGAIVADWVAGGDEFPSARSEAPLSSPARLLPPAESAPRRLDLADVPEPLFLGEGWLPFVEAETGRLEWGSSRESVLLMPVRSGDRVSVAGWLPPRAGLPSTLTIEIRGVARVQRELETPGAFQVDLEPGDAELAGDFIPIFLTFSRTFSAADGDRRAFGAFIQRVELY